MKKFFHQKLGLSLVEAVVTIFVFSVLMLLISLAVVSIYKTKTYQWEQALAVSEARIGVERMVKEIRQARNGENGAYPIAYAGDKEFIFYADVDNDGKAERVRYFLGQIQTETLTKYCESNSKGGSCTVVFSNFLKGNLLNATLRISVRGDLNRPTYFDYEYLTVNFDGQSVRFCYQEKCSECASDWENQKTFNVTDLAKDGEIIISAQASCPYPILEKGCVHAICSPGSFSFKIKAELETTQYVQTSELKRGIIKATGTPPTYPSDQEKVSVITKYVRNTPPIFEYFDQNNQRISDYPARLKDTKVMKIFLVVNVDPTRPPTDYQLESYVQLRNLKQE